MARCPVCGEYVDRPASSVIRGERLLPPAVADASKEAYVQLECPACEAIMGYLGVAAAAASADVEVDAGQSTHVDGAIDEDHDDEDGSTLAPDSGRSRGADSLEPGGSESDGSDGSGEASADDGDEDEDEDVDPDDTKIWDPDD